MAADTKQNIKTLRVDNWAIFFLQRLQLMFAKGDACDLTLNFHTGQELKVHRLVLITCTTFFENLAKEGDSIIMPEDLPYSVVQPIINFLYSGKLEFKPELHSQLLSIAKSLDITILAKLLITQKNDNGMGLIMKNDDKKSPQRTFLATRIGPAASKNFISGKKLPIWRQRTYPFFKPPDRRIIKEEDPKPRRFDWPDGKEPRDVLVLTTPSFTPLSYESENVFTAVVQPDKAGGFPGVRNDSTLKDSPAPAIYTPLKRPSSGPVSTPEKIFKAAKKDASALMYAPKKEAADVIALSDDDDDGHFETIHSFGDSDDDQEMETSIDAPGETEPVLATPAVAEPAQESVPSQVTTSPRSYSSAALSARAASPPGRVSTHVTSAVSSSPPRTQIPTPAATPASSNAPLSYSTPKPILKPINDSTAHTPGKKVRFSLIDETKELSPTFPAEEGSSLVKRDCSTGLQETDTIPVPFEPAPASTSSSNEVKHVQPPTLTQPLNVAVPEALSDESASPSAGVDPEPSGSTMLKSPTPTTYSSSSSSKTVKKVAPAVATNHAKIIAEVLKKYPELVRNNKNIRLKISSPGTTNVTNLLTLDTKKTDGRSSYMVVKSYVKTEGGVKSAGSPFAVAASTSSVSHNAMAKNSENPWSCSKCSTPEHPRTFENYLSYCAHMMSAHQEKLDPRSCEYCGYRTAKRNLLLYHQFTKHKVEPPQNVNFPKCDLCGHVALSDALLQKHVLTHKILTDWPCPKCKVLFKSSQTLRVHLATCKKEDIVFSCTYCDKKFRTNILLNDHSRNCAANPSLAAKQIEEPPTHVSPPPQEQPLPQASAIAQEYDINDPNRQQQNVEMIEVPLLDTESIGTKEHTFIQLPNGLILVPAQPQQLRRVDGQQLEGVGNEVALIRNGGSNLDQMAVNQNITLLSSDGGEAGRNSQMGLTMALPQDQHVILLDANSDFFIQGNDSVVVTRINDAADEYIVPEVIEEGMQDLYTTQALPYAVTTSATSAAACSTMQSGQNVGDDQSNKQDDCGSTVVRVQNSSELDSVQIRHPDEMGTIIVQDVPQSSMDEQHHLFAEETSNPPRPHMSINKELMDVVAMEVQRTPSFLESGALMSEVSQTHHTVLRQTSNVPMSSVTSSPAQNVYHRMESRKIGNLVADNVAEGEMVIEEEPVSNEMTLAEPMDESGDTITVKEDCDSEEERMAQRSAAKADSFVKDWGFDNEEDNDAADLAGDETDDDNDDGDRRIGPSRVTVEL